LQDDAVQKRSELLGSNEQLRAAVGRSSADLKQQQQQQAAAGLADASREQLQEQVRVSGKVYVLFGQVAGKITPHTQLPAVWTT
jgi:hypothetical protein